MNRRAFLCGLTLGTLIAPLPARAQQAARLYRVGILAPGHEPQPDSTIRYFGPFRQSLADSNYVEGRNVSFAYRWGGGDFRVLPALANELVRVGVDVLFAASTPAIRALMGATTTIPIVVVTSVLDPIDAGMAASLARPGGNITGVSGRVLELNEKLLELLKESKPSISRAAVFGHPEAVGRDAKGWRPRPTA